MKGTVGEDFDRFPTPPETRRMFLRLCDTEALLDRPPQHLSGGELQRTALCLLLLSGANILLLDEPSKGLDALRQAQLGQLLQVLCQEGYAVLLVSHDTGFCAQYASRCSLFFDGACLAEADTRTFFADNQWYTTPAQRLAAGILPLVLCPDDMLEALSVPAQKPILTPETPTSKSSHKSKIEPAPVPSPAQNRPKHLTWLGWLFLALIPLTLYLGIVIFDNDRYYLIAVLVLLESLCPLFLRLEAHKPSARELSVLAVLCAVAVLGRVLCFALPQVKPVMAIVILSGIGFGREVGALTGALSMLLSNLLFGQGPWTPFQMFAMGLIGFFAGLLFGKKKPNVWQMGLFSLFAGIVLYGGIMNPSSALMWMDKLNWNIILAHLIAGFPMDVLHSIATMVFIMLLGKRILAQFQRLKEQYGVFAAE